MSSARRGHPGDLDDLSASLTLSFPRLPRRLVPRPHLMLRLDRLADVTVIEALPGYGKRTLTGSWAASLERAGIRVVWLRATAAHDTPRAVLSLLHQALHHAGLLAGPVPSPRPAESDLPGWARQLARSTVPIVVVVENAHLLRDRAVAEVLARMVRVVHPLHLVVLAEGGHWFHAAATQHGLEANVLRAEDLAITPDELGEYAEAWGHRLSSDTAHLLYELVGGWLLPIRLVLDATPAWADEIATRAADEFLHEQILAKLDEDAALAAATRLAVPERLTATLVAAALGEEGPADPAGHPMIEGLHCRGLVWRVPRQSGETEWQMPALVRRVLLSELGRRNPELQRSVHGRVARALADSPDGSARSGLLGHARAAEDWSTLASLWSHEGWPLLEGEPEDFSAAFTAIPAEAHEQHPVLMLAESLADALQATTDEESRVETLLRHYMKVGSAFLTHPAKVEDPDHLAHLLTAGLVVRRTEGRLDEARQLAAEAAHHFARAKAGQSRHLGPEHDAWLHLQWGLVDLQDGRFGDALQRAVIGYEIAPRGVVGASCAGLVAALHALSGDAQEARQWLEAHGAAELDDHWSYALAGLPARIARATLALDRLDIVAAEEELSHTNPGRKASGLWPLTLLAHTRHALHTRQPLAMLARLDQLRQTLPRHHRDPRTLGGQVLARCSIELMLALGEVHRVQARLNAHDQLPPWLCAPTARHHLITGEPRRAVRVAAAAVHSPDVPVRDRQDLLTTMALALRAEGKPSEMAEALSDARALGRHTGNLQPLLEIPLAARESLLSVAAPDLTDQDQARLAQLPPLYPAHIELIRLSPRELEVLQQTRHHNTVQEVARALSVSVNTVKKQLTSLYAKLGVHDRASALQRAHSLGLVDDHDRARPTHAKGDSPDG